MITNELSEDKALAEIIALIKTALHTEAGEWEELPGEEYVFFLEDEDTVVWHRS